MVSQYAIIPLIRSFVNNRVKLDGVNYSVEVLKMTSEEYIEDLRRSGVKLIKNDGSVEIPPDFLKRATELCSQLRCSSVSYDIFDPQDSKHTKLRVLECVYAE